MRLISCRTIIQGKIYLLKNNVHDIVSLKCKVTKLLDVHHIYPQITPASTLPGNSTRWKVCRTDWQNYNSLTNLTRFLFYFRTILDPVTYLKCTFQTRKMKKAFQKVYLCNGNVQQQTSVCMWCAGTCVASRPVSHGDMLNRAPAPMDAQGCRDGGD